MNPLLLDLPALRAFVAVARDGNVSRAAARLYRTQPAVSLQLKKLQALSGLVLFQRTAHGMVLSADGAALLQKYYDIKIVAPGAGFRIMDVLG